MPGTGVFSAYIAKTNNQELPHKKGIFYTTRAPPGKIAKTRLKFNRVSTYKIIYFLAAGALAAVAAAAGAPAAAAGLAAAAAPATGTAASSCFNTRVNTMEAIGIRGEL